MVISRGNCGCFDVQELKKSGLECFLQLYSKRAAELQFLYDAELICKDVTVPIQNLRTSQGHLLDTADMGIVAAQKKGVLEYDLLKTVHTNWSTKATYEDGSPIYNSEYWKTCLFVPDTVAIKNNVIELVGAARELDERTLQILAPLEKRVLLVSDALPIQYEKWTIKV